MPEKKYESIKILKGAAILMVFLVHSSIYFQNLNTVIYQITRVGRWGCQAFFVVSGFTLALSWNKRKSQKFTFFLKKRFERIAFYWYLAIVFYQSYEYFISISSYEPFTKITTDKRNVLATLFLLNGLSPSGFNSVVPGGWYIGTQWIFYLLFPAIIRAFELFKRKKIDVRLLPLGALILSFVVQMSIAIWRGDTSQSGLHSYLQYSFINQMPCFLSGVSLYYLFVEQKRCNKPHRTYGIRSIEMFAIASIAFYFLRNIPLVFVFVPIGYALCFCYLFLWLESMQEGRLLQIKKGLIHCGNVSYEAYYANTVFTMILPFHIMQRYPDLFLSGTISYLICLPVMMVATLLTARAMQHSHNWIKKK